MVELAGVGSAMVVEAAAVERVRGTVTGHGHETYLDGGWMVLQGANTPCSVLVKLVLT